MESPKNVSEITRPEVYMVPINLKDAFYLATVHKKHQQFLKYFEEGYLKFVYMPNSCKQAMWVFTKTSEITFSFLTENDPSKVMIMCMASLMFRTHYYTLRIYNPPR